MYLRIRDSSSGEDDRFQFLKDKNNLSSFWKSFFAAIVEFVEPAEARTAFKRLAYSRFKNLPLYLEWAPEDTFTISSREKDEQETEKGTNLVENMCCDIF